MIYVPSSIQPDQTGLKKAHFSTAPEVNSYLSQSYLWGIRMEAYKDATSTLLYDLCG